MTRKRNDGRAYQIVKNFSNPDALAAQCARAGRMVDVRETATCFLYGAGTQV